MNMLTLAAIAVLAAAVVLVDGCAQPNPNGSVTVTTPSPAAINTVVNQANTACADWYVVKQAAASLGVTLPASAGAIDKTCSNVAAGEKIAAGDLTTVQGAITAVQAATGLKK